MHAAMRLGGLAGARADDRLRCMKARKVGIATGIFSDTGGKDNAGAAQTIARLVEKLADLRGHRSTPSRRISPITPVGFRYAPAGYGLASMKASVSARISLRRSASRSNSRQRLARSPSLRSFRNTATS